jgi:hypothetical protein
MEAYSWNLSNRSNEKEIYDVINISYNIYLLESVKLESLSKNKKIGHFKLIYTKMLSDIKNVETIKNISDFVDVDLTCLLRKRMLADFNLTEHEVEIFYSS